MSVIIKIREKGSWILISLIALALIAFILQDGLSSSNRLTSGSTPIGIVNSIEINKVDFDQKLSLLEKANAASGVKREDIIPYLWTNEVNRILIESATKKIGIKVGSKEIEDIVFGNESPFRREFTDQKTGEFKINDLKNAINSLKKSKDENQKNEVEQNYIAPAIQQRLTAKYQSAIQQGMYIPTWYAQKLMNDNQSLATANYVYVPYNDISDSTIKVEDDDISKYVQNHPALYTNLDDTRSFKYVRFQISPSSFDSSSIKTEVLNMKKALIKAKNGDDVQKVTNLFNANVIFQKDQYAPKDKLKPTIIDSIGRLKEGDVMGPYIEGKNFEMIKLVGIKQRPDSASVRHILVMVQDPKTGKQIRSEEEAKRKIDSIEAAIKRGADFTAICAKNSEDPGSNTRGGVYPTFAQGFMVKEFNDFTFDNPVGKKGVVKTVFGYHYIEVLNQKNYSKMYNVAYISKEITASSETVGEANNKAVSFAASCKSGKDFQLNAQKLGYAAMPAENIKENDFNVQGIEGACRSIIRWIFENKMGDISEPIQINNNIYVVLIERADKKGIFSVEQAKQAGVEAIVRNEKKGAQIAQKLAGKSLDEIASVNKKVVIKADSIGYNSSVINGIGFEPKAVGSAFNKSFLNKISSPINGNIGSFVVQTNNIFSKPSQETIIVIQQNQRSRLKSTLSNFIDGLNKGAKIEDNRHLFY